MQALLDGGIAFATPDQGSATVQEDSFKKGVALEDGGSKKNRGKDQTAMEKAPTGTPAANGATFVLHDEPKDEWLKWRPVIMLKR
jgi:hypothetical protein